MPGIKAMATRPSRWLAVGGSAAALVLGITAPAQAQARPTYYTPLCDTWHVEIVTITPTGPGTATVNGYVTPLTTKSLIGRAEYCATPIDTDVAKLTGYAQRTDGGPSPETGNTYVPLAYPRFDLDFTAPLRLAAGTTAVCLTGTVNGPGTCVAVRVDADREGAPTVPVVGKQLGSWGPGGRPPVPPKGHVPDPACGSCY